MNFTQLSGEWIALGAVIGIIILAVLIFKSTAGRYIKVSNDEALVISGRNGTRIVTGGATFVWPFFEDYYVIDLKMYQFEVLLENVPTKENIPVNIEASVSASIDNLKDAIIKAASVFGRKKLDDIARQIKGIVDGHVRALIGQASMESILRDQNTFKQNIQDLVASELSNIGNKLHFLNIKSVSDKNGVIAALGQPAIAKVKSEAAAQSAEQEKIQIIATTTSKKQAAEVSNKNLQDVAMYERDREVVESETLAQRNAAKAKADQAGPLAAAEAQKAVVVAKVQVQETETEATTKLQEKVKAKNKAEYEATILTQAEAEKQKKIIDAGAEKESSKIIAEGKQTARNIEAETEAKARVTEATGTRQALELTAEGKRIALEKEGEGEANKRFKTGEAEAKVIERKGTAEAASKQALQLAEATGRKANAEALEAEQKALAAGRTANADAENRELSVRAEGQRLMLLAQATGTEAQLTAQAKGVEALLATFANLTPEQIQMVRTKWMLEAMPGLIVQLGDAGQKIMSEVAKPIAASIAQMQNVTIYDSGNGNGASAVDRFAKQGPQALMQVFRSLQETGMLPMVAGLAEKLGIDVSSLMGLSDDGPVIETEHLKDAA